MKKFRLLLLVLFIPFVGFGQSKTFTFTFLPENDMFFLRGNEAQIEAMYDFVGRHADVIKSGEVPVYVTSFSSALPTWEENIASAKIRANRVKSELIVHKGLVEDNFRTRNRSIPFQGQASAVIVEITVPEKPAPAPEPEPAPVPPVVQPEPQPEPEPEVVFIPEPLPVPVEPVSYGKNMADPYCFALRTNIAYWAGLVPNIGVEWRPAAGFGLKLDGGFSAWNWDNGNVIHKLWFVNPELRWYMGNAKRFYLGAHANFGHADINWEPVSWVIPDTEKGHGYEGSVWNAGLSVGYQARLAERLSLDLGAGFGYNHFNYDAYIMDNGNKQIIDGNVEMGKWFLTQVQIALVWRFGK